MEKFMNKSGNDDISQEELDKCKYRVKKIKYYYSQRVVGQENLALSLLVSVIANGHILLESVPGLAKTTAAKAITEAVSGKFSRIQCTPDLLPSDIIGTQTFNYSTNTFDTKLGPVYANFVLLDEINRSSAKTQSAMLEAMQERQVTIGGEVYKMPKIFIVIATQNPIEQEGTYMLAEAQLDRFLLKEKLDYPTVNEEVEILSRIEKNAFEKGEPVVELKELRYIQKMAQKIYIDDSIKNYIVNIIDATRHPENYISKDLAQYITLGSSTRGAIAFMDVAKAVALINGRGYVIPDDVKLLKYGVLRHRITLSFVAMADNVKVETIIDAIFGAVPTP